MADLDTDEGPSQAQIEQAGELYDEYVAHLSPIDEAARRERLAAKGYDEEEIIRDANFSHGFAADGTPLPQQNLDDTPAVQRNVDTF